MKVVIVLVLSLTAVYNQGFQSGRPVENLDNPRLPSQVQNPRIRRTPNPYYGLYNYLYASPFFNRPAAMTRRNGAASGLLRNSQQPARPTPTRAQAPDTAPQGAPQRFQQRVAQRAQALAPTPQRAPQRLPQRVAQRAQARQRNVNPYGFGRGMGMLGGLHGLRDRSRMGEVSGFRGLHGLHGHGGRHRDRTRGFDGIRGIGLGGGLYGAMAGSGWKSYGGSSGGKGSYYYRHTGSSGGHYGGSYKGSYYYRGGGGGGHGNSGYGHGNSYWSRR